MVSKKLNSYGQTLIEAALCVPILGALCAGVLFFIYTILISHWTDFWAYRSLVCLIEQKKRGACQKNLEEKLQFIVSKNYFEVQELWINDHNTKIKVQISIPPFYNKLYEKQIALPLTTRVSR